MPRKTRARRTDLRLGQGFNEAAARCRGKREDSEARKVRDVLASMRPRPDAAENARQRAHGPGRRTASMRPRPDAAENSDTSTPMPKRASRFNEAAARCRGKQTALSRLPFDAPDASMRPRPDAAENRDATLAFDRDRLASMRPRPDAAENFAAVEPAGIRCASFNEAAARCRGKPAAAQTFSPTGTCFNEAAARCRGKLVERMAGGVRRAASMRPRPEAAENAPLLPDTLNSTSLQ